MAFEDAYDLSTLKNHTEELVYKSLEQELNQIADEDICKCNTCVVDMACLALNKLAPRYRASLLGTIYSKAEDEAFEKEVAVAVDAAVQKIGLNPAH